MRLTARCSTAAVLCCAGALLFAAPASTSSTRSSSSYWTAVSGYANKYKQNLPLYGGLAIVWIQFLESSDDPIKLYVDYNYLDWLTPYTKLGELTLDDHFFAPGSPKTLSFPGHRYLTAVKVCTDGANDSSKRKLKGIQGWASKVDAGGDLFDETTVTVKRTNCKVWHNKVSCGAGELATGLRGYYSDSKYGFHGLALRCTPVSELSA